MDTRISDWIKPIPFLCLVFMASIVLLLAYVEPQMIPGLSNKIWVVPMLLCLIVLYLDYCFELIGKRQHAILSEQKRQVNIAQTEMRIAQQNLQMEKDKQLSRQSTPEFSPKPGYFLFVHEQLRTYLGMFWGTF